MRIVYMPGGIGAVAYNNIVAQHPNEPGTIVAFSGGSLLNLAQGKFGKYNVDDVRWLAAIGTDYGVAVVRNESPYTDLKGLMEAFKQDPTKIVLGAGGTVGSQDWMKAALTAKAAGVDFKKMRFVAFEGGGEAVTALRGGHIQAYMGDAAEAFTMLEGGAPIRVLAVFNDQRLPGKLGTVPTAKEQGYDIVWPIIRGFYVGPKVSDADYQFWVNAFNRVAAAPEFAKLREQQGLFPFNKTGADLDAYVKQQVKQYAELADSFGLVKK
jgi:putative tricarboxylic transport membrane protein